MENKILSIILDSDSYKASHYLQYPPGTQYISSYIEARAPFKRVRNRGIKNQEGAVFLGMSYYIQKYLSQPITKEEVDEAEAIITAHGEPFNRDGWMHIVDKHGGWLPLYIESLPEGTVVPSRIPMVQVHNTDPEVPWLTSYIETSLLRTIWYPTTVATLSREIKILIANYLERAGEPLDGLPFMLHDFGSRGVSSQESAGLGGMAHLVNFMGTDTLAGLMYARKYYNADMPGFSIPAAEHSTITSWGPNREVDAYRNMLKLAKPGGIVAVVSDSYDIYNAVENIWGGVLKEEVEKLGEIGAKLVIRPDSGTPEVIVPEILKILEKKFPTTKTHFGFKKLPPYLAVIQGDGINYESIDRILRATMNANFSPANLAFGMGGALLQQVNRDTLSFAMKANAIGFKDQFEWCDVWKKPVTDSGKASKAGRQAVMYDKHGKMKSVRFIELTESNLLQTQYNNGFYNLEDFKTIRERACI